MRTTGKFFGVGQISHDTNESRVLDKENSLVWHQQVLGWLNKYSGVAKNPGAVTLEDTIVPVVNINPPV